MMKAAMLAHAQALLEIDREQDFLAVGALQKGIRLRTQGAEITLRWGSGDVGDTWVLSSRVLYLGAAIGGEETRRPRDRH